MKHSENFFYPKGRTINDLGGGARAKAGKKNSTATRPGKKKVQRLVAE